MTRLFVAVWPSAEVHEVLHALDVRAEPGVRPVPSQNWHITLRFLGHTDAGEVGSRLGAATMDATTAELGPAVERLGRNQLVVPVRGVDALATTVVDATRDLGEPPRHTFFGHLTVARTKRALPSAAIGREISAEFAVREIALVASELTPSGAVYTTLATFPIGS